MKSLYKIKLRSIKVMLFLSTWAHLCGRNSYFNYCGDACVVYEKDIRSVVINGLVGEYRSIPVKDDVGFL